MDKPEILGIPETGGRLSIEFLPGDGGTAYLFGGAGYNMDMPVLYRLRRFLLDRGLGVSCLRHRYLEDGEFLALDEGGKDDVFDRDAKALGRFVTARGGDRMLLAGKSMGTTVMLRLLGDSDIRSRCERAVWLTPGTHAAEIYAAIPGNGLRNLVAYGSMDAFSANGVAAPAEAAAAESGDPEILVVEGGDHSLETGDQAESARALAWVLDEIGDWLDS